MTFTDSRRRAPAPDPVASVRGCEDLGPCRARERGTLSVESEYHRYGTLAYLAVHDVHRARVFGRCEPSTAIKPFTALVDQVTRTEPYASAPGRRLLLRHPAQTAHPDDFEDLDELTTQILAFEKHDNTAARPFDWRFTRADLNQLLTRIRQHDRHAPPTTG